MFKYILIGGVSLLVCSQVMGANLGVKGRIYSIDEVDMRLALTASASQVDWEAIHKGLEDQGKHYAENLPAFEVPPASENRIRWYDLSITLTQDIVYLEQGEDGHYREKVLAPAGTTMNPFEHVRPITRRLYFDGRSEAQVRFVQSMVETNPLVTPIATAGNPQKLTELFGVPVSYAKEWELGRFNITHTPSLIGPGAGAHATELAIYEFGVPYTLETLDQALKEMP